MIDSKNSDRKKIIWAIVGVGLLFILPSFLSRFSIYLMALIFTTGLLATSLNLVLGFGGMYQFHHAVFYGTGAYTVALFLTKTSLPGWVAFVCAPISAALLSLLFGLICVRLSNLYFGMFQLSLGSLVWAIVYRWYDFTHGDDGIHGIPAPDLIASGKNAYFFTLIILVVSLFIMYRIVHSPFGRIFLSVRDNPERSQAVGVNVRKHQLIGMIIAGFFAGVAGSLFVVVEGSVFPELLFWTLSLEVLIMCLLGGWFTFLGPLLGAAIIVLLRTFVGIYTEYWTLVLGIVLMLLIFFLPEGVLGYAVEKYRAKRNPNFRTDIETHNDKGL